MMGHKICLFGEIQKIISELYLLLLIWSSEGRQNILELLPLKVYQFTLILFIRDILATPDILHFML